MKCTHLDNSGGFVSRLVYFLLILGFVGTTGFLFLNIFGFVFDRNNFKWLISSEGRLIKRREKFWSFILHSLIYSDIIFKKS